MVKLSPNSDKVLLVLKKSSEYNIYFFIFISFFDKIYVIIIRSLGTMWNGWFSVFALLNLINFNKNIYLI